MMSRPVKSDVEVTELRAEIERLRETCQWWSDNRDSWFKAAQAAGARVARVESIDESVLYDWIAAAFAGNGSVRFDSDAMDEDEMWVRHIARSMDRRLRAALRGES